jgi:hypothetical protein
MPKRGARYFIHEKQREAIDPKPTPLTEKFQQHNAMYYMRITGLFLPLTLSQLFLSKQNKTPLSAGRSIYYIV